MELKKSTDSGGPRPPLSTLFLLIVSLACAIANDDHRSIAVFLKLGERLKKAKFDKHDTSSTHDLEQLFLQKYSDGMSIHLMHFAHITSLFVVVDSLSALAGRFSDWPARTPILLLGCGPESKLAEGASCACDFFF